MPFGPRPVNDGIWPGCSVVNGCGQASNFAIPSLEIGAKDGP